MKGRVLQAEGTACAKSFATFTFPTFTFPSLAVLIGLFPYIILGCELPKGGDTDLILLSPLQGLSSMRPSTWQLLSRDRCRGDQPCV